MMTVALGGLVAITEPLVTPLMAIIIGGIGGALVFAGTELLTALKIDDVVGAICSPYRRCMGYSCCTNY